MPKVQGLSKSAANYRPAPKDEVRCAECMFMFPRLSVGGCRYVRGVSTRATHATSSPLAARPAPSPDGDIVAIDSCAGP